MKLTKLKYKLYIVCFTQTHTHVLTLLNVWLFELSAETQIYYLIYAKYTYQNSKMFVCMIELIKEVMYVVVVLH